MPMRDKEILPLMYVIRKSAIIELPKYISNNRNKIKCKQLSMSWLIFKKLHTIFLKVIKDIVLQSTMNDLNFFGLKKSFLSYIEDLENSHRGNFSKMKSAGKTTGK